MFCHVKGWLQRGGDGTAVDSGPLGGPSRVGFREWLGSSEPELESSEGSSFPLFLLSREEGETAKHGWTARMKIGA